MSLKGSADGVSADCVSDTLVCGAEAVSIGCVFLCKTAEKVDHTIETWREKYFHV